MGINCVPLVADLFLFCYERDFMTSLSDVKQAEIIEAFKSTSRYLDDLLNIDNPYFEGMVNRIYPPELQLNKANTSDTEAPFLDLHLSISNGFVSSKIYDKRDDFDFDIVNFPFWDGDVPRSTSNGVYISQHIRFARVFSHVADFNARNKSLTAKLLQQGYRYHKLRKTFSKFYRRHYELVSKFNAGLKTLLHQGISEPEFYGDLVYKFKQVAKRATIAHLSPMCQGQISFQNIQTHPSFNACSCYMKVSKGSNQKQQRKSGNTIFPIIRSIGVFLRRSRAANSVVGGPIWPKFELIHDIMHVLVTSKFEKDPININKDYVMTSIF